jgi:hypothetical protein
MSRKAIPALERFNRKYQVLDDGCWQWLGAIGRDGYGNFTVNGKTISPQRFAYEQSVGVIESDLQVIPSCGNRSCVNPDHLDLIESLGAFNANKTHCPDGHPYDSENTYITPTGKRMCKACRKEAYLVRRFDEIDNPPALWEIAERKRKQAERMARWRKKELSGVQIMVVKP